MFRNVRYSYPSGGNRGIWEKKLEGVTEEQFTKILKMNFKLRLEIERI